MTLREKIADAIRTSILPEAITELRAEIIDELRQQAQAQILEENQQADEDEFEKSVRDFILDEYFEVHHQGIQPHADVQAEAAIATLRVHCDQLVASALKELRACMRDEIERAADKFRVQMEADLKKLTNQIYVELRVMNRNQLEAEVMRIVREIIDNQPF